MANKGRRMVFEEDIKKIGEGSGSTYTAGEGITIENDEISVDYDATGFVVAVNYNAVGIDKNHYFVELPGDYNGDYDEWFKHIPVLKTNSFTDGPEFGHYIIEMDPNESGLSYLDLAGTYIIRDTANNINQLICTYSSNIITAEDTAQARQGNLRHYLAYRSGNNSWSMNNVRYQGETEFRYLDPTTQEPTLYITAHRVTRNNMFGQTSFGPNGIENQSVEIRIAKLKPNYNAAVAVPTTEGTYKMNVHVDSNGEVDNIS